MISAIALLQARAVTHLVIVGGIGGEPQYTQQFHEWGSQLAAVAVERAGVSQENVHYLAERVDLAPGLVAARSTRDNVEAVLGDIAASAGPDDQLVVVLLGHGTEQNGVPKFNLPGPDLTAPELAVMLGAFDTQAVTVVNTSSSSGGFIAALSGPNRVIMTATRSGRERNHTRFAGFFLRALGGGDADVDKDNRVSMLEAFNFARLEVERHYSQAGQIQTEHALLDDNADSEGSPAPDPLEADGALARRLFLGGPLEGSTVLAGASDDPELNALYSTRTRIEESIAELRAGRDSLALEEYENRLEDLIVELAATTRAIRAREEQ